MHGQSVVFKKTLTVTCSFTEKSSLSVEVDGIWDSVRPVSPQVQRCLVHLSGEQGGSCPSCRDCSPTGEGAIEPVLPADMKTVFYHPYFIVPNLGPSCLESSPSQAPIQDVNAETHLRMHSSPRQVCNDRHEGCIVSCLPQHRPRAGWWFH